MNRAVEPRGGGEVGAPEWRRERGRAPYVSWVVVAGEVRAWKGARFERIRRVMQHLYALFDKEGLKCILDIEREISLYYTSIHLIPLQFTSIQDYSNKPLLFLALLLKYFRLCSSPDLLVCCQRIKTPSALARNRSSAPPVLHYSGGAKITPLSPDSRTAASSHANPSQLRLERSRRSAAKGD